MQSPEAWVEAHRLLAPLLKVYVGTESTSPSVVSTLSPQSPAPPGCRFVSRSIA